MCVWNCAIRVSRSSDSLDGLPAVVELLRVLVNILDPNDKLHTDSTRLVSMRILNSALEVCGSRIGDFSSLASLVSDHGCKFLFQLARSDNPSVAQLALRTIATIFETMRKQLKLQQELFLAFTIDRLAVPQSLPAPSFALGVRGGRSASRAPLNASPRVGFGDGKFPSAPESPAPIKATVLPAKGETRELLLDTLTQLSSHPSFMVDLYMNYDCDINCEDLYGRLVEFLSQVSTIKLPNRESADSLAGSISISSRWRHGTAAAKCAISMP